MKPITKKVYQATDGTIFTDKNACEKHEAKLADEAKTVSYWLVRHGCDCSETGYLTRVAVVRCEGHDSWGLEHYLHRELMEDWCFRTFGRRVAFVQGVSVAKGWELEKSDKATWEKPPHGRLRDRSTTPMQYTVKQGEGETGLVTIKIEEKAAS